MHKCIYYHFVSDQGDKTSQNENPSYDTNIQ